MLIRESAVAGQFYPGSEGTLREAVESFLKRPQSPSDAKGVLVPHAGYIYSGAVAGKVFSSVQLPGRFIILGPNHTGRGAELALAPAGAWRTPLGLVEIDGELNHALLKACPGLGEDSSAHRNEHCLEVQIPFLQVLQPEFKFSAICLRTADYDDLEALGRAMAGVIRSQKNPVLLIASSDMTHYEDAQTAASEDRFAIDQILARNPSGLYQSVLERGISMCGFAPMVSVLVACNELGATSGELIQYTNSGETSGDYDRVVAYAGIVIH